MFAWSNIHVETLYSWTLTLQNRIFRSKPTTYLPKGHQPSGLIAFTFPWNDSYWAVFPLLILWPLPRFSSSPFRKLRVSGLKVHDILLCHHRSTIIVLSDLSRAVRVAKKVDGSAEMYAGTERRVHSARLVDYFCSEWESRRILLLRITSSQISLSARDEWIKRPKNRGSDGKKRAESRRQSCKIRFALDSAGDITSGCPIARRVVMESCGPFWG